MRLGRLGDIFPMLVRCFQWCRNSSDLSDNRTFLMYVRQKMLECRTKCPTEIIKKYPFDG